MPKKICICFDGTSNHPRDARQEREWFGRNEIEDNGITNVLKLHVLLGGTLDNRQNSTKQFADQRSFYYSGVGTYGGGIQRLFNAAFAPPNQDVRRIINKALDDLKVAFEEGDQVFLFGFSRGAALARRFAAVIRQQSGLTFGERAVRFVGVFDTVASLGAPNLDDHEQPISDVVFESCDVSPDVEEALHLVSLDENRTAFLPTLMNKAGHVTEIWFPGAHADVGGGFWIDGLSDVALDFMLKEIARRGLGLVVQDDDKVDYKSLVSTKGNYQIDHEDVHLEPDPLSKAHPKDRWGPLAAATLCCRDCRVNVCGEESSDAPVLHWSVRERVMGMKDYRPKSLKGQQFVVLEENGDLTPYAGLVNLVNKKAGIP